MGPIAVAICALVSSSFVFAATPPNNTETPGWLCSASDPNFQKYDYPEHIARCKRNVNAAEKQQVADEYGNLPKSEWTNYEFDHLIPLCAGGSDDVRNIWPQPLDQAKEKDKLEDEVCKAMAAGTMTQAEMEAKVHAWFAANLAKARQPAAVSIPRFICYTDDGLKIRFDLDANGQPENATIQSEPADLQLILPSDLSDEFKAVLIDKQGSAQILDCESH